MPYPDGESDPMSSSTSSCHAAAQFAALSVSGCRGEASDPEAYSFWYAVTRLIGLMSESGLSGDAFVRILDKVVDLPSEWKDFMFFCPGEGEPLGAFLFISCRSGSLRVVDALPGLSARRRGDDLFIAAGAAGEVRFVAMHWWGSGATGDCAGKASFAEVEPGVYGAGVPGGATVRFMATFN